MASARPQTTPIEFDLSVREHLINRSYPGNVRELRQLIHRIAHRHVGPGPVTVGDLPEEDRPRDHNSQRAWPDEFLEKTIEDAIALGIGLKEIRQAATETGIRIALRSENGNLHRAARRLGVSDRALQMRCASGGIPRKRLAA
jgi:transcriptional regulator with GAF, ATPase, and Fis domain